jgi:hypothetical protein
MMDYQKFLEKKSIRHESCGFITDEVNPILFDWQQVLVKWALYKGRAALFEDCGLGKTPQQLEWAKRVNIETGKPVLILAPLAVSQQTKREGEKFGIDVNVCKTQDDVKNCINITNYEKLNHFYPQEFAGVVLDECFPPETPIQVFNIDNSLELRHIKDIRINDKILNASGEDYVKQTYKRRIDRAVRIIAGQRTITSSENHPYFTMYGWRSAQDLQPGDYIMETETAVRLVRDGVLPEVCSKQVRPVLRDILLSEMEDVPKGYNSEDSQPGSGCEKGPEKIGLAQVERPESNQGDGENHEPQPHVKSRDAKEGFEYIAEDEAQAFRAWGEWSRDDIAAAVNEGCTCRKLGTGIFYITGKTSTRFSDMLQGRLRESRLKNCNRSGREHPLQQERERREEGQKTGFTRVDSVEILEQGHPELDKYRDADGYVYFYDIKATRHPSFSVDGLLVHNSSILKNYTGKIRNQIIETFLNTPYKLCATATPSPNDYSEIGNTSEFLGVMTRAEMLSMYFINDTSDTGTWRLKGHVKDNLFWQWIASWAVMIQFPSNIGFDDNGFVLPKLNIHEHIIPFNGKKDTLFVEPAATLSERRQARKESLNERADLAAELINNSNDTWLVWCNMNDESAALKARIQGAVEVKGSDSSEHKEKSMLDFQTDQIKCLITKPSIAGFGMNWQNCHNMAFVGLSDSYEQYYQAVRRCWRFGQEKSVNAHIITGEREGAVVANIKRKERDMQAMFQGMIGNMANLTKQELTHSSKQTTAYNPAVNMTLPKFLEVTHA